MSLVEFKNVNKRFGKTNALTNVNIKIEKGKIYGLLGPNGSGKTTMIKLINDLIKPTNGEVLVNDHIPGVESKKIISYLPEKTYLNMNVKVSSLLEFFSDFYKDFDKNKALKLLKKLKINTNDKLKTMSKGTKEKVQLIIVMSRKADLYILDEPIGGVDPASRDYILETILSNFSEESSIIISTHLIADIEKVLDDIIFINKGEIILNDSAEEIRTKKKQTIDSLFREEFKC
ncbi:MAG: ABC transporter ATP-binding protein [Bacilli bacterium]